jgi:hypothetical protein
MMLLDKCFALAQGFGDLHHDRGQAGDRDEGVGDAHVLGLDAVVAKQHLARPRACSAGAARGFPCRPGRPACWAPPPGRTAVSVSSARSSGARRGRQVHRDPLAVDDVDQAHDGIDVVGQLLVVGLVGDVRWRRGWWRRSKSATAAAAAPASSRGSRRTANSGTRNLRRDCCHRAARRSGLPSLPQSACRFLQAIAQSAYRRDAGAARFQLLAQAMDIDLDGVVADFLAPTAQLVDQLVLATRRPARSSRISSRASSRAENSTISPLRRAMRSDWS